MVKGKGSLNRSHVMKDYLRHGRLTCKAVYMEVTPGDVEDKVARQSTS